MEATPCLFSRSCKPGVSVFLTASRKQQKTDFSPQRNGKNVFQNIFCLERRLDGKRTHPVRGKRSYYPVMAGCSCCVFTEQAKEARRMRRAVDSALMRNMGRKTPYKVLMTGSSGSGKTTFVRQAHRLIGQEYNAVINDVESERRRVHEEALESAAALLRAKEERKIDFVGERNRCMKSATNVEKCPRPVTRLEPRELISMKVLWKDPAIRTCFTERYMEGAPEVPDLAKYFLDNLNRYSHIDFKPNEEDLLRLHTPTTGIREHPLKLKAGPRLLRLVDMGGHPSERSQWVQALTEASAILFLVNVSLYDAGDEPGGLEESRALFRTLMQICHVQSVPVFVLFNKIDVLKAKLPHQPLSDYYPSFEGPNDDLNAVCAYLAESFVGKYDSRLRENAPILTNALSVLDLEHVRFFFRLLAAQLKVNKLRGTKSGHVKEHRQNIMSVFF